MRRAVVTEQILGEIVVEYLEALDADVYQEVDVPGGTADIVARVGAEIWIVEIKTSLSLALLTQAMDRRRHAHRVFVAAPHTKNMRDVAAMCEAIGVGLLDVRVTKSSRYEAGVHEVVRSRRWNRRPVALANRLKPEHKTHAKAGAIGAGGRWTPFVDTCEQLAKVVAGRPGIRLKDAIKTIKHHYSSGSSARASLMKWIERGKVPGVRLDAGKLYPSTTKKAGT